VARREHGANQKREQDCGPKSANRRTDGFAAEAFGEGEQGSGTNSQIEWDYSSTELEHASAFFL
jgi:hypothetical protein